MAGAAGSGASPGLGPTARAVLGNTLVQAAGKGTTAVVGIAMVAILTRYLGAADFGIYTLAFAYLSFFQTISDLGLSMVGVRQLAKEPGSASTVIESVFFIRLLLAVVASLSAIALSFAVYPGSGRAELRSGIAIVAVAVFVNMLGSIPVTYFQARLRMQYSTIAEVTGRVVTLALVIAVVALRYPLNAVFVVMAVGYAATALLNYVFARELFRRLPRLDLALSRRLLLDAAPLGIALVVNSIYFRVDTVILSLFRSNAEVGWYGFSYRVLEIVTVFFGLFTLSTFPVMVRYLAANDRTRFQRAAQRALDFLVITTLPTAAVVFILATRIASVLGGDQFSPAVASIQILAVATAFMGTNSLFGALIIGANRQKDALWLNFVALAVNVGLNLALIPSYGYIAAAWITVVSEMLILGGEVYLVRRFLAFVPRPALLPKVVAGLVVMCVAAVLLDRIVPMGLLGTLGVLAVTGLVYVSCASLLGVLRLRDMTELLGIRPRAADA